MPRPLRIEYEEARYHVMCRGNQQGNIFLSQEDVDLFLQTLSEMCGRNHVVVHAWCIMSNHYHLLLETPHGNLVDAMKWFQGSFTQRYNARHRLWGHLFQGRYKAKVIDDQDGSYFRAVGDYIHLNPAEAGLVGEGKLAEYKWSSYPVYLWPPSRRPKWLATAQMLSACGIPADTAKGRKAYEAYMNQRQRAVATFPKQSADALEWQRMERGWVHGSKEFHRRMIACLEESGAVPLRKVADGAQKKEIGEAAADKVIRRCLTHFNLNEADLIRIKKGDPRKMLMAALVRYHFPVSVDWVSTRLHMGHFTTVCRAMHVYDNPEKPWDKEKNRILELIG
jgi:putative transposase